MAQLVKNLPAIRETLVQSLGRADPLEEEMATHSIILGQRSLAGYSPWGREESDTIEQFSTHTCTVPHIGGIPQYSQLRQPGMLAPSSTFCSIQALSGPGDVHPHWGGLFAGTG